MRAVGNYCVIITEDTTRTSGIQVKSDGMGKVHSCVADSSLVGKIVLYDDRQRHTTYDKYIIVNLDYVLAVIK